MRKIFFALSIASAAALIGSSVQAQNLLTNGNLDLTEANVIVDNAPVGPGAEDFFLPKPKFWVNEGSRTIGGPYEDEMSSEPWAGPAPTPVTTDGNANPPFPEGTGGPDGAVFFKPFSGSVLNGAATGHLYQDAPATPGVRYVLAGWAGAEPNSLMADAQFALEFLDAGNSIVGSSILSLLPTLFVDNGEPFDYKKYSVSGTAPAGTVKVRARASMIGGMGNPAGGGQAYVIDDFELTAVPEPSTIALAGLGLLALTACRGRSARK